MKKLFRLLIFLFLFVSGNITASAQLVTRPAQLDAEKKTTTELPDLVVTITSITYSNADSVYTIAYTIRNDGKGPVDMSLIKLKGDVYNHAGNLAFPGCETSFSRVKQPSRVSNNSPESNMLKTRTSYNGSLTCAIPLYTWHKDYSYKLEIDPAKSIKESNEKNNIATASIIGYLDLPDLTIESATWTWGNTRYKDGVQVQDFTVNLMIRNMAVVPASLDVYVIGNFGNTHNCAGCGRVISGSLSSNLKIGAWGYMTTVIGCTMPVTQLQNQTQYAIAVDCYNKVAEKDENNNSIVIPIPPR